MYGEEVYIGSDAGAVMLFVTLHCVFCVLARIMYGYWLLVEDGHDFFMS